MEAKKSYSKKRAKGFTLVEMLITVVVISIIGSTIAFGLSGLIIEKRDEGEVLQFWSELVALRARAMKDNVEYRIIPNPSSTATNDAFQLTVNTNGDGTTFVPVTTGPLRGGAYKLKFGRSSVNGDDLNKGVPSGFDVSGENVDGEWADSLFISFKPDAMGSINNGIMYFANPGIKEVGYAIVKFPKINRIKLYKRSRAAWNEM